MVGPRTLEHCVVGTSMESELARIRSQISAWGQVLKAASQKRRDPMDKLRTWSSGFTQLSSAGCKDLGAHWPHPSEDTGTGMEVGKHWIAGVKSEDFKIE